MIYIKKYQKQIVIGIILILVIAIIIVAVKLYINFNPKFEIKEEKEKPNMPEEVDVYVGDNIVGKAYVIEQWYKCFTDEEGWISCTEELREENKTPNQILMDKEVIEIKEDADVYIPLDMIGEYKKDKSRSVWYTIFRDYIKYGSGGQKQEDVLHINTKGLEKNKVYYVEFTMNGGNVYCVYTFKFQIVD